MNALRILIVEDEPMIAMMFEELLEEMGHDVVGIAATESAAVEAARQHQPDLMFVDENLAKGSGISAIKQILQGGFVAHIFTSGDKSLVEQRSPNVIVLSKPFREQDLVHAMEAAMQQVSDHVHHP